MSSVAAPLLTGTVAAAISDEKVLGLIRQAWVTRNFLILRNVASQKHTIIPLTRLASIDVKKTPYSGLLAVAAGIFVVGAAALASRDGDGAALPCLLLGAFLVAIYLGSRRADITFRLDSGAIERAIGTVAEASELVQLIERARFSALADADRSGGFSPSSSFSLKDAPKAA
ncbi:MAG TPA: hypothetical protein VFA65_07190 [Bryobacteraceae bacterium]|nr:hypothetical protein [Bryobacteraceae bacterium]